MEYVLETNGLTKSFRQKKAVDRVNLKVAKGDIFGFIGRNGAGKTTLIRMLTGLAEPDEGVIELFGSKDLTAMRSRIGTVIENPAIFPHLTAEENLIVQCKVMGEKDPNVIPEILRTVGLADTGKKKAKNFSLGMKQRLAIAVSLIGNPDFLILDEPTNGLDPTGIREIREMIQWLNRERGITVLISSHILGELSKLATRYGIIDNGTLIEEFTDQELWERCKSNLVIQVQAQDIQKAQEIIRTELQTDKFTIQEPNIILMEDYLEESGKVNRVLAVNNIIVESISVHHADLEEYFIQKIGGNR